MLYLNNVFGFDSYMNLIVQALLSLMIIEIDLFRINLKMPIFFNFLLFITYESIETHYIFLNLI